MDTTKSQPVKGPKKAAVDGAIARIQLIKWSEYIARFGVLIVLIGFLIVFGLLEPDRFLTSSNLRSLISTQTVLVLLALAVIIPLIAGEFDLSLAFMMGLSALLAIGLPAKNGVPWAAAVILVLLVGALAGLMNGLLVVKLRLNSFIVTLGTGVILAGFTGWYSAGAVIYENIPQSLVNLIRLEVVGLPVPVFFTLALAILLWYVLGYTPLGRYLYAIGGGREAARLAGVRTERLRMLSFVIAALIASLAGIVLAGRLGSGHPDISAPFLLPAFAAAFLGAASWKPGFFNVWGTLVAVYALAVGINGLQIMGVPFWVEDVFNGTALIVAVALSRFTLGVIQR